ncbi:hypothetical protein TTHERM_000539032 (macronuclear) [Tetrahymena thermophila SB210]|uniref:Uncharacterized protein n=1 Tax=Tetrahymena thermophila (strain SB210) TaxID=312017 RepID=W7XAN2_TETTS|nr:hypothetical protein TTHERM_000539032 [Tetrahymena thermophila SB210]EWS76425.1 hypothetical protein TTHERM_000539032 [Tetrahymena thermophila SB210]|eukprot:XP_012651049.1 hypothetical protein TTHERM_000539032 [Tetrahymena thermophila SB210]
MTINILKIFKAIFLNKPSKIPFLNSSNLSLKHFLSRRGQNTVLQNRLRKRSIGIQIFMIYTKTQFF